MNTAAKGQTSAACGRRLDETQLSSVDDGRDHDDRVDGRCMWTEEAASGPRATAGAAGGSGSRADQADTASGSRSGTASGAQDAD